MKHKVSTIAYKLFVSFVLSPLLLAIVMYLLIRNLLESRAGKFEFLNDKGE